MTDFGQLEQQWRQTLETTPPPVRAALTEMAQAHAAEFADAFYSVLLEDADASEFLSHNEVDRRLHVSLQRWIFELLSTWDVDRVPELLALQRHVAVVHSRQNIRMFLVLRGARLIKRALIGRLRSYQDFDALRFEATAVADAIIDMAMEGMSMQYAGDHDTATRTDEAYRAFAATANTSLERERLRNSLLDWENRFLQEAMIATPGVVIPSLGQSAFGLWIRHKAPALFGDASELGEIVDAMDYADYSLIPLCHREIKAGGSPLELRRRVTAVLNSVKKVRGLLDLLFEHLIHLENGRDSLTQLLSRRFLATILSREVALSRKDGKHFSILLIDVDNFKSINDQYGHQTGDRVLQHLASTMLACVRSGDFVFRYGGEEFLVICVELSPEQALQVAEKIRIAVASESIVVSADVSLHVSVSIGVAAHDGHPDYLRLIDRADQALYQAKNGGRNRSVLAQAGMAEAASN